MISRKKILTNRPSTSTYYEQNLARLRGQIVLRPLRPRQVVRHDEHDVPRTWLEGVRGLQDPKTAFRFPQLQKLGRLTEEGVFLWGRSPRPP